MIFQIFVSVIFGLFLSTSSFEIVTDSDLTCKPTGIQCLNLTSFTTCSNVQNFTLLTNVVLICPDGYICDTETNYPCISNTTTTTTSTTPRPDETTTTSTTTKAHVPRPNGEPTCTDVSVHPAPACNQYYQCEQSSFLLFWKSYKAVLYTCSEGLYYDTGSQQCITASLSDCI